MSKADGLKPSHTERQKLSLKMRIPAWVPCVCRIERPAAVVQCSRDNASGVRVGISFCAQCKGGPVAGVRRTERFTAMKTKALPQVVAYPLCYKSFASAGWPHFDTPPDSSVIVFPPQQPFEPQSPRDLASQKSFNMTREQAEAMALMLNRDYIQRQRPDWWHVVSYQVNQGGFKVVRLPVPAKWQPVDEYSEHPLTAHRGLTNCTARRTVVNFNSAQLTAHRSTGEPIQSWCIHSKPLRRPE